MKKSITFVISMMLCFGLIFSPPLFAGHTSEEGLNNCIKATFVKPPKGQWYWSIDVSIKNTCDHEADLKEASFSIETPFKPSEARFSFNKSGMSWAETNLINQVKGTNVQGYPSLFYYTNSLKLAYGDDTWLKTKIVPQGELILTIAVSLSEPMTFTNQMADLMKTSFKVFSNIEMPPEAIKGKITFKLGAKPESATDFPPSASFSVTGPSQFEQSFNLNWGQEYQLDNLTLGTYNLQSSNISYNGHTYQAQMPGSVSLTEESSSKDVDISYQMQVINTGTININLGQSPSQGLNNPSITITDLTANSGQTVTLDWGNTLSLTNIPADHQYLVEASAIDGFTRTAQPSSFTLVSGASVDVSIQYMVITPPPANGEISLSINGLPTDKTANITFTNNDTQQQTVTAFSNGVHSVILAQGLYTVTASPYQQYHASMVNGINPVSVSADNTIAIGFNYANQPTQKRIVAYFTAWGIYGRNYQVTDIPALKVSDIN